MALYPVNPPPSNVSAPAIIDPVLRYSTDAGYEVRRARVSRPRRRYTLDYLGQTTATLRLIRDFIASQRANVVPCQFYHPLAVDLATINNTTPVILTYEHGLVTGQWVGVGGGFGGINGFWQITRLGPFDISLNGTTSSGTGQVSVIQYLPQALVVFSEDTWPVPTKLIGPDQIARGSFRSGYFSWSVTIEEVF